MEHKIVSEYDRIRPENSLPMEHDPTPDSSGYSASKPPRFWLPRRALALAALVLVLTTLAAALWPENLKGILHRNRDISQIGVPIGVPEASSAPAAPSPTTETKAAPFENNVPGVASASRSVRPTESGQALQFRRIRLRLLRGRLRRPMTLPNLNRLRRAVMIRRERRRIQFQDKHR